MMRRTFRANLLLYAWVMFLVKMLKKNEASCEGVFVCMSLRLWKNESVCSSGATLLSVRNHCGLLIWTREAKQEVQEELVLVTYHPLCLRFALGPLNLYIKVLCSQTTQRATGTWKWCVQYVCVLSESVLV